MTAMFDGVFCPSISITKDDGTVDRQMWSRHLGHLISAGIDGVLLFGSIGEFYAYTLSEKKSVVDFAIRFVDGRMKTLVGVGGTNLDEVVELARYADRSGADGVLVVSPYYFGPSEVAAERFFGTVADSVELPVLLYNFPARTGNDLSPELVAALADRHSNIVGIKDTVDTISHTRKMIHAVREVNPDFSVLSGFDEYYVPNRIAGGNGVLCGLTNVEPETFVGMDRAWRSGDFGSALSCAQRVSKLMRLYDQSDLFISAIKEAVKSKGLSISTSVREPYVKPSELQLQTIERILA